MRILLSCLLCLVVSVLFAQVKTGIQVGYNHASFEKHADQTGGSYFFRTSAIAAFNAGIISAVPVGTRFYLQPSLLLSQKGVHLERGGGFVPFYTTTNTRLYYADVPVNIVYAVINSKQLQVLAGAGGYISYGIWGYVKGTSDTYDPLGMPQSGVVDYKVRFTNNTKQYDPNTMLVKPFDIGGNVVGETIWKNIQLTISYSYGFTKVMEPNLKNRLFSISAGYYLFSK